MSLASPELSLSLSLSLLLNTIMADRNFAHWLSVPRLLTGFVLIASTFAVLPLVSGTTDASDGMLFIL